MKAKNSVVNGDYKGKFVGCDNAASKAYIIMGFRKAYDLTKENVVSYELLNSEQGKVHGAVGTAVSGALFGIAGAMAASAKTAGIYQVAINFKDGKRSLIECDEKIYKALVAGMF